MDQESSPVNPADGSSASSATDGIRSQIEQTRAEMSETIDAIQDRLSPRRLVSTATETMKDAAVTNPFPIAILGAAAAALTLGSWMDARNGDFDRRRHTFLGVCTGLACWSVLTYKRTTT
jgi:hypothetical protein